MTSKEAFELLKRYEAELLITKKAEVNYDDVISARYEISKLVERDTPIQIFDMGVDNRGIIRTFICPVCHQWLTFTEKENFCPKCGQRLNWSE